MDSVPTSLGSDTNQQTRSLLRNKYWWPEMTQDVSLYAKACSVCAISQTPRHLPAGKLVPLPIPNHPWSHIGINLATDLPPSESYTCILVVVNRFSKACMLIPFERVTHSIINCRIAVPSCFPPLQTTRRPLCLRLWAPIHIPSLVFLLSYAGYFHQPQTNGQTERNIQAIER